MGRHSIDTYCSEHDDYCSCHSTLSTVQEDKWLEGWSSDESLRDSNQSRELSDKLRKELQYNRLSFGSLWNPLDLEGIAYDFSEAFKEFDKYGDALKEKPLPTVPQDGPPSAGPGGPPGAPGGPISPMHPSQFPDGGAPAWLCVAGASAAIFCSFGWINCIGIFNNYYISGPLQDYSPSTVGWIVSTESFFMLFCSPFVGLWFDNFGPRWLLLVGTFLHVFGLMMTSLSTKYYQYFLGQGVCSAIGAGMIFTPAMNCVVTWFFKKRGLALGLTAAGSSLGGVIFPIIVTRLLPRVGFPWAMRTCAFIILALMIFANLTVKSRVPPMKRPFDVMAFIRPLKEVPFLFVTLATLIFYFGMFVPFAFIVDDAVVHGMNLQLSQYLMSILNAFSIFGRTLPGYIGDKIGRYNTIAVMTVLTSAFILGAWIPATTNAVFIVFAGLFGFGSGAAIGLTPALIAQISNVKEIGVRTGTVFGISSFAALTGTPIAGALVRSGMDPFLYSKVFAGVMCFGGFMFFLAARITLAGPSLMKKV